MWCDEHRRMVRRFDFEEDAEDRTHWCSVGGNRCRLTWRNIETVDFDGARN